MRRIRGFTFVEMLVVVAILAVFAWLVIPGLAGASAPIAAPVGSMIESDLQRAKAEAIARGMPMVLASSEDGAEWWVASSADPTSPIDGTRRSFGRASLVEYSRATLHVHSDYDGMVEGVHLIAVFNSDGTRDGGTPELTLRDNGSRVATWTLPSGRTRLAPD